MMLPLTPDELLTTTRAVRRKLDLSRPVDPVLIEQCLVIVQQAPSGGNQQDWGVVVTDPGTAAALADLYRRARDETSPKLADTETVAFLATLPTAERADFESMLASADHLAAHLHGILVLVVLTVGGSPRTPVSLPGREATATSWEAQAVVWRHRARRLELHVRGAGTGPRD
jgi:nitroreductase